MVTGQWRQQQVMGVTGWWKWGPVQEVAVEGRLPSCGQRLGVGHRVGKNDQRWQGSDSCPFALP